jgi:hypothetical protein
METFETLGRDVIIHIFSHVALSDLTNVMLVCKNWKKIANDEAIWKAKFLEEFGWFGDPPKEWKAEYIFRKTVVFSAKEFLFFVLLASTSRLTKMQIKVLIIGPSEYLTDVKYRLLETKKFHSSQIATQKIINYSRIKNLSLDDVKGYNAVLIFRNVSYFPIISNKKARWTSFRRRSCRLCGFWRWSCNCTLLQCCKLSVGWKVRVFRISYLKSIDGTIRIIIQFN